MNKKIIILFFILIGLFLFPLIAKADTGRFGLGFRGGWYKANDANDGKLYGGLQARWKVFPALAIEGSADYRTEESYSNNRKVTSYPVLVSALFYLIPEARVSPYLLGGVGWYYSKLEDNQGTTWSNDFGAHLGGGLDISIAPRVVFNADLRYYFLNIGDQKVKDLKTDGYIISAGLTFYLW